MQPIPKANATVVRETSGKFKRQRPVTGARYVLAQLLLVRCEDADAATAANLFSLMITCKRLGVEPYAYLHDILRRLPHHPNKNIWQLTSRGWKETFGPQVPPPSSTG